MPTNPTISQVTVAQGTGVMPQPKMSILDVSVNFQTNGGTNTLTANIFLYLSFDDGTTFTVNPCITLSSYPGTNLSPGGSAARIFVDLAKTVQANNTLTQYSGSNAVLKVVVTDSSSNSSTPFVTPAFTVKTTLPSITSALMAQYIGWYQDRTNTSTYIDHTFTVTGSTDIAYVRNTRNPGTGSTVNTDISYGAGTAAYVPLANSQLARFTNTDGFLDGFISVQVKAYDQFFNESPAVTILWTTDNSVTNNRPWFQYDTPTNCVVTLVGSVGNSDYTGIFIEESTGSFYPDRLCAVQSYGLSPIPLFYRIEVTGNVETPAANTDSSYPDSTYPVDHPDRYAVAGNVGSFISYNPNDTTTTVKNVRLTFHPGLRTDDYNADDFVTVNVTFQDAAGNQTVVTPAPQIRFNTRIYKTTNKPLRPTDATYKPVLREDEGNGTQLVIDESVILPNDYIRTWYEIFYPLSHSFPVQTNGDLNEAAIYLLSGVVNGSMTTGAVAQADQYNGGQTLQSLMLVNGYDPLVFTSTGNSAAPYWQVSRDTESRAVGASWVQTKQYPAMVSSAESNLQYWVLDNQNYGDFDLEFEFFYLDSNAWGPPFNPMCPYKGDVLIVYDASAPGSLVPYVNAAGENEWELSPAVLQQVQQYKLTDSTLLTPLFAFTGSGLNVINLMTGTSVNSGPNGSFSTPVIRNISKLVLIFYSDVNVQNSGFKLKASDAYQKLWTNYDVDQNNGEVWVHKLGTGSVPQGSAGLANKLLTYDYYDRTVTYNLEQGIVTFGTSMAGYTVTSDYSYHQTAQMQSNLFLATNDDFVDYDDAPIYVGQVSSPTLTTTSRSGNYLSDGYGLVIQVATFDTDKGLLTFQQANMPGLNQRVFSDYYFHTYTRLTADGYGDMTFRNSILVPDLTDKYPDYTWADIKLVNEGDETLEKGTLVFGFRGYDTTNDGKPEYPTGVQTGAAVDQVWDPQRPWDVQEGTAEETYQRLACCIQTDFIWDLNLVRPMPGVNYPNPTSDEDQRRTPNNMTATGIYSTYYPTASLTNAFEPQTTLYGRVVWALGQGSTNYPSSTTPGSKKCSIEAAGQYYSNLTS